MPNGQAAQLANLTPFQPGSKQPRYDRAVLQAFRYCKKLAPEMVDTAVAFVRDESMPPQVRVKCLELILDKAMPVGGGAQAYALSLGAPGGISWLELRFSDGNPSANGHAETFRISFDHPEGSAE